jgi:HPt (histidine-containing phosphotransfer) domain-containing protein
MVCDLSYLTEMMDGKKHLIKEIMDEFLKQIPGELQSINEGVAKADYGIIKNFSHKMRSSVSIMGISSLTPVLQEMEDLGSSASEMERIVILNQQLQSICGEAMAEIEREQVSNE